MSAIAYAGVFTNSTLHLRHNILILEANWLFSGQLWVWPPRVGYSPQRFCRRLERMWPPLWLSIISDGPAETLQFLIVFTMLYGPTMFFIKTSVLLLYRKLFYPDRWMRILVHIGIGYLLITNGVSTIIIGALYVPRNEESHLIKYRSPQYVNNILNLSTAVSVCNLIADWYLHFLPLPIIWKLQMSTKKRYALIGLFTSGFL